MDSTPRSSVVTQRADVWMLASPGSAAIAHCVSADFAMGAGFAAQVSQRYPALRHALQAQSSSVLLRDRTSMVIRYESVVGQAVYNLVTKTRFWMRADRDGHPNRQIMERVLLDLQRQAELNGDHLVVMPQIGTGLDRLPWAPTEELIRRIFHSNQPVSVVICLPPSRLSKWNPFKS